MSHMPYPFEQVQSTRYKFFSLGRNRIEKIVDFVPLKSKNLMSLGFGDLSPDGSVDYMVTSNNGDIGKVLATVVMILKHFTALHPEITIGFTGSTVERTRMYARGLKMCYAEFSKEFIIYGNVGHDQDSQWLPINPRAQIDYFAFLIKRI